MQNSQKDALSRRAFVSKLATGAAGAAIAIAATTGRSDASLYRTGGAATLPEDDYSGVPDRGVEGNTPIEEQELTAARETTETAPVAPWNILRPLTVGSVVAADWRVVDLTGAVHGSCVLTLGNEKGRAHRVHICRNDGQPRGLIYTNRFDLVVMNGGGGDLPTEEGFGQAVAAISHVIASNEATGRARELANSLLAQADREQQFGASSRLR